MVLLRRCAVVVDSECVCFRDRDGYSAKLEHAELTSAEHVYLTRHAFTCGYRLATGGSCLPSEAHFAR
jgi:hypothetical protein